MSGSSGVKYLLILIVFSCVSFLGFSSYVTYRIDGLSQRHAKLNTLNHLVFEFSSFLRSSNAKENLTTFYNERNNINLLLSQLSKESTKENERVAFENMRITIKDIDTLYTRIAQAPDPTKEFSDYVLGQLNVKSQVLVSEGIRAEDALTEELSILINIDQKAKILFVFFITLLVSGLAFVIYYFFIKPIDHLSRAVTSISNDNLLFDIDPYLPTKNTEVGRLALTFVQLSDKLRFYYTSLDSEVKSRTKELLEKTTSLEEQVKETQKFKMAVTSSTDAIVITDADGNIVYVNKAWENLNKYSSQEALGKNPRILNSSQTPSDVFIEMWSALKGGKPYSSEQLVNKRKDGSTYEAALAVYPILSKEKTLYYVGVQHDITERKMIERAKSDFVSLASHQLRTPLSAINWYIEMLLNGDVGNLTKEQTDVASVVMDSSKRMGVLIEALLNVARIESNTFIIKPEPINIKEMLDNILLTVGVTASKKNISISFAYDFSLPTINLDKNIAEVIFTNLLTNAIKYTPNEGIVTVTVTQFPELSKNPTHVLYKVADNGYGIPESAKSNIFSKLYRANNVKNLDTDGTGLGLYTVKSVVESIGGKVWFESTEGEGSTFYVTIPLSGMQAKEGSRVLNVI